MTNEAKQDVSGDPAEGKTRARAGVWLGPFTVESLPNGNARVVDSEGGSFCYILTNDVGGHTIKDRTAAAKARATLIAETLNARHPGREVGDPRYERLAKHVTRFLEYPGFVVDHPEHGTLPVTVVRIADGDVFLTVADTPGNFFEVRLDEVAPAGLVADAVRIMFGEAMSMIARDYLARAEVRATLAAVAQPADMCEACGGTGVKREAVERIREVVPEILADEPQSETVHNLSAHDAYVLGGDGHCEPDNSGLPNDARGIAAVPQLVEALAEAPLIGFNERADTFRKRQDVWIRDHLNPALRAAGVDV